MHDPLVVAFEIPRPWPKHTKRHTYWPALVTVWHREPGGKDSGEVCKHYLRFETIDGWQTKYLNGWKLHVHHWRIQIPALQHLRRRLLTRCEWCGGPSRKGDAVNVGHGWNGARGPWWRGERGLFHLDCSGVPTAKRQCLCDEPMILGSGSYGECLSCGQRRYGRIKLRHLAIRRLYATVPDGERPSLDVLRQIDALAEPGSVRSPRLRRGAA